MRLRLLLFLFAGLIIVSRAESKRNRQPAFQDPPIITSENGVLTAQLVAAPGFIEVGGKRAFTNVYNGAYIPPVLDVNQGDTIKLRLVNLMGQMTNLHYHGFDGSPLTPEDDVFLEIQPANTFDYELHVPATQEQGLQWYHPHMHGLVEAQIFGGMSGAYIINGLLDPFPQLQGITQRVMLLKDIQIKNGQVPQTNIDIGAPAIRTVNGLVNPRVDIAPGETQLWRVGNIGADRYYKLRLDGHTMYEIARDGSRHTQLLPMTEIFLPPASRSEFLIQGAKHGTYGFRTLAIDTGPQGDQYSGATLATLVSSGPRQTPIQLPTPDQFPPIQDLRDVPLTGKRSFVFSESANGDQFFINGQQFNPDVVNTTVQLGSVEEWTIQNDSKELHTFHLHQTDIQVTEINGEQQPFVGYQDNVNLPFKQKGVPGEVKVIIPFTDPIILGKFVYHCHITQHEDAGMMAVIEVVP